MNNTLHDLVTALPEVYQTIFGHPEWDDNVSRNCNERLDVIYEVYTTLSKKLGRPLKVLDLGCAQGFFSLSLASRGATVKGIDFLDKNINVCRALAKENTSFDVEFDTGRIEDIIEKIEPRKYDLVIGLSVFHHIVHEHGIDKVRLWLSKLADSVHAMILELALKNEPLYWGPSLPEQPEELIENCKFYRIIAEYQTHLSSVIRPMYVVSNDYLILNNYCEEFTYSSSVPYKTDVEVHENSRRYYFNADHVCKYYNFSKANLSSFEQERSRKELLQEIDFLSSPPSGFSAPQLVDSGTGKNDGWVVMERISGDLLSDALEKNKKIDLDHIIRSLLEQLVILEENGYYHDDIRSWNILIDRKNSVNLIDFGSISNDKKDCVWPDNIFLAFNIFLKEILIPHEISDGVLRSASISPFNLPGKYENWLHQFWRKPVREWTFRSLLDLFNKLDQLPELTDKLGSTDEWIRAQEKLLMNSQSYIYKLLAENEANHSKITQIENHIECSIDNKLNELEVELELNNQKTEILKTNFEYLINTLELKFENKFNENVENVNSFRSSFEQTLVSLKESLVKNDGEKSERLSEEKLIGMIEDLQHKYHLQVNENARLHAHIAAMTHSSSWRITAGWRKTGRYVKAFRSNTFGSLYKKIIKITAFKALSYLNERPLLKTKIVSLAIKFKFYDALSKMYRRINYRKTGDENGTIVVNEDVIVSQADSSQLPAPVKEIYSKLKR
ncbi:methyltransferase domain-containing protein [Pantoea agglomerans]|uniref:methyltransferase domain-containing protein n=1 Tax=Enterobacter agglomerans TaxID=549 RepID=UPI0013CCE456|nr:methyltransferase domain-containing protein [Pantoea agglomerans]NEG61754.1 methyltransferase domain-containing protein [Pantoea agglomerans]